MKRDRVAGHLTPAGAPWRAERLSCGRSPIVQPSQRQIGSSAGASSRWGVFGNVAFTVILIASSVSNIGIGMFDTSMSWLMTSLNPDPMMVSAVQVATWLPMFLLTFPAGALADLVDARRLLIGAQAAVVAISVAFAAIVSLHWTSPTILLATSFLLGIGGAIAAPAWLLITPMLVPRDDLDSAIAINNTSFNVSRAIGPALGGFAIAAISIDIPFWCYCAGNLALLAAIVWWRASTPDPARRCPPSGSRARCEPGLRYARYNRDIDSTLIRAVAFFIFASAYWALLPLVAQTQMHNGAAIYGILLGMIGLGSIIGSFGLNWLKERLGPDRLAALGTVGTIAALVMYGAAREPVLAMAASLVAGASWIVVMTTLFVSAQVALPEWVRGRGLAIFLTVYFGAMTLGSALWGKVASLWGLPAALYVAAAGAFLGLIVTWGRKLQTAAAARPLARHALAQPRLRPPGRGRRRPNPRHDRIQGRSGRQGAVPGGHAGDRLRAQTRRRLCLECV